MSLSKLEVVLRLNSEKENQAALKFKASKDDYAKAEDTLNQALSYRVEYEEMSVGVRPNKFTLIQLTAARSFLTTIDNLIENQRAILREKLEVLEIQRERWQLIRAKTKSIEAIIAHRKKSRFMLEEKNDQKRLDDLFGREFRR